MDNLLGVPCGTAHNEPIYQNPAFRDIKKNLLYGNKIDYSKVHCPEAKRIYESEVIALDKDFLMERKNVDLVIETIRKVKKNIGELLS